VSDDTFLAFAQLRAQVQGRVVRLKSPRLIDASDVSGSADTVGVVPPRGTLVVSYAGARDGSVRELADALESNDRGKLIALASRVNARVEHRQEPSQRDAYVALKDTAVLFDVRYRGKTVVESAGLLPGYSFGTITLAYLGGTLNADDFVIAEYLADESDDPGYDYLVAARPPVLTELERAVLKKMPDDLREMVVGLPLGEEQEKDTFKQVADVAKEMVEREKTTWHRPDILERLESHLRTGEVSVGASIASLMQARRELILRSQKATE
jgi:hypothetical protein